VKQPCGAATKSGGRCRAFVPPGRPFCASHDPAMAEALAAARMKGDTAAAKIRLLQGKRLRLETPVALAKFMSGLIQNLMAGTLDADTAKVVVYAVSVQRQVVEHAEKAELEKRLVEIERLLAQRRLG
jgi:hypothetical protein